MLKSSPARPLPLENVRAEKFIDSQEFLETKGLRHLGIVRATYKRSFGDGCSKELIEDTIKVVLAHTVRHIYPNATHIFEYHAEIILRSRKLLETEYYFYITANAYENPNL